MKISEFSLYLEKIEKTPSRLMMTELLAQLFSRLSAQEISFVPYLVQGRVAPLYAAKDFGLAQKLVMKSIEQALHIDQRVLTSVFEKTGDLGKALTELKSTYHSFEEDDLTIENVFKALSRITEASGSGSQSMKTGILSHLIRQTDPLSAGYIVRIPLGVMRLGFSDMTILDAFSWMLTGDKSLRKNIEHAYHVRPDLGFIGSQLKQFGIGGIGEIRPQIFTPIIMMRAERLPDTQAIIDKIGECFVESKYDGFRLQIHVKGKTVRLYSRNLEEVSHMYPDLIAGIQSEIICDEIIFEGEAIGYDPSQGTFLPFQETVQRKRKYDIRKKAAEIPLKLFAFELLYKDGISYIREPFVERRKVLRSSVRFPNHHLMDTHVIALAPEETVRTAQALKDCFEQAVADGLEGIIAKKMDGRYQPGARGWNWIKFKRSYSSKVIDTMDCVVLGFDRGKGKRLNFGIGAFLAGVYDKKNNRYVTVAKVGTGLTDEEWKELYRRCDSNRSREKPDLYEVDAQMSCDVWVTPFLVVEIAADEISRSPVHTAGRVLMRSAKGSAMIVKEPGYALRFPRLTRFRDDKNPEDATDVQEVASLYTMQQKS